MKLSTLQAIRWNSENLQGSSFAGITNGLGDLSLTAQCSPPPGKIRRRNALPTSDLFLQSRELQRLQACRAPIFESWITYDVWIPFKSMLGIEVARLFEKWSTELISLNQFLKSLPFWLEHFLKNPATSIPGMDVAHWIKLCSTLRLNKVPKKVMEEWD